MQNIKLTQFSHGGGCGCKISPEVLQQLLANLPVRALPNELSVGTNTSDDAAVYQFNDSQAVVATTGFFPPIIDARERAGLPCKQLIPLFNRLEKDGWVRCIENERQVCRLYNK